MDPILTAYLKGFVEEFGLKDLSEAQAFEHFVNYCAISKHHPDPFEPDAVVSGGGGDLGLDGIAILVNDHLVSSREEVDHLRKFLHRLDVQFIFTQAKRSPKFDGGDIGTVFAGVRQFFESALPPGVNTRVKDLHKLKEYIFTLSLDMDKTPTCRIYYGTTGVWKDDVNLLSRIDQGIGDLNNTHLFSSVTFVPLDLEALKRLYRELHNKIVREILFDKHTILPQIAGVQEAYIGIIPCPEYLRLISNDDGTLNRRLFYDNVRDFQGHNPVNREIESTIHDSERSDRFALLNNGVTVVARDVNKVGARFRLVDFQIVNGCQTSHILHLNRDKLTPQVYLPIKLIVTADNEVTNQVIQGTNRQTEVKLEAFESLLPFQKKLEELYLALGRDLQKPLYYERRSKQYDNHGIEKERIVTLPAQIKCFIAMFLNEPQSTHRYYGELLSSYRSRIFSESHSPFPYYIAGLAMAKLERLFLVGVFPRTWRPWKYLMLMVFRLQNETMECPPLNGKAIEKYCEGMLQKLQDDQATVAAFRRAGETVEAVRKRTGDLREEPERSKAFTAALIEAATNKGGQGATTLKSTGTVKYFSDVRGFGFITADDGQNVYVHWSHLPGTGFRFLQEGQRVQFALADNPRGGMQAVDVELI